MAAEEAPEDFDLGITGFLFAELEAPVVVFLTGPFSFGISFIPHFSFLSEIFGLIFQRFIQSYIILEHKAKS